MKSCNYLVEEESVVPKSCCSPLREPWAVFQGWIQRRRRNPGLRCPFPLQLQPQHPPHPPPSSTEPAQGEPEMNVTDQVRTRAHRGVLAMRNNPPCPPKGGQAYYLSTNGKSCLGRTLYKNLSLVGLQLLNPKNTDQKKQITFCHLDFLVWMHLFSVHHDHGRRYQIG